MCTMWGILLIPISFIQSYGIESGKVLQFFAHMLSYLVAIVAYSLLSHKTRYKKVFFGSQYYSLEAALKPKLHSVSSYLLNVVLQSSSIETLLNI